MEKPKVYFVCEEHFSEYAWGENPSYRTTGGVSDSINDPIVAKAIADRKYLESKGQIRYFVLEATVCHMTQMRD